MMRSVLATSDDQRRRARMAISRLFLDTELDDRDFTHLRDELRATRLALPDLDRIYFDEVAPILFVNLMSPAGVWAGFDAEWLEQKVQRHAQRRGFAKLARLRRYITTRSTIADWRRLRAMVAAAPDPTT